MPGIDSFSLDNYGIDGTSQGQYQLVVIPDNTSGTVSVPAGQTNFVVFILATIPAGSSLITLIPANDTPAIAFLTTNSQNPARLALLDNNNIMWPLSLATNGGTLSFSSASIDLVAPTSAVGSMILQTSGQVQVQTTASWNTIKGSKPSNFNTNGPMRLAIIASNSNTSASSSGYSFTNFKVVSV